MALWLSNSQASPPNTSVTLAARGLAPIIKIYGQVGTAPFFNEALRDPIFAKQRPNDEGEATRLAEDIKQLRSDLVHAPAARALELNEQAYESYAELSYYLEDVANGLVKDNTDRAAARNNLASVRRLLLQHANAFVRLTKNPRAKARAVYNLNATLYLLGGNSGRAVVNLRALLKEKLDASLRYRCQFIVASYEIEHGGEADRAKAAQTLRSIAAHFGGNAGIAVRLVAARGLAGINSRGTHASRPNSAYRSFLWAASGKVSELGVAQKEQVFSYEYGVWRTAEAAAPGKGSWNKPPFRVSSFAEIPATKGILERAALEDWQGGNAAAAIRKYQSLARQLIGNPSKSPVDLRILDLKRSDYLALKNPRPYEQALVSAYKVYLDPGILGDGQEAQAKATLAEITRRYQQLVRTELARVNTQRAATGERLRAIALANRYLSSRQDAGEIESIKAQIAHLYVLNQDHAQAVAIYKDLADTRDAGKARRYLLLAIASQSVLADWPTQAPWLNQPRAARPAQREDLLSFYKKFGEVSGKQVDWFVQAQSGLLDINLGRQEAAFSSWRAALKTSPTGAHAANAAGYMLIAYQGASDWADLEQLARDCLQYRIMPIYRQKRVSVTDMLALALLEGGKQAMQANQFAVAVKKFEEFVRKFPGAKNYDEGYFLLASAYRGNAQHINAIKTLQAFVEHFQHSSYFRQALLNGGDWSTEMAYEDNAMFFYGRFAKVFSRDDEATRIRDSLKDLYLGRELYAEAIGIMTEQAKLGKVDAATRTGLLQDIMTMEERHGSQARAAAAADTLIASRDADASVKAQAMALKARLLVRQNRLGDVQRLEQQLTALSQGGFDATDALGEVRFILAKSQGASVIKDYFNLALSDPLATLNQRYAAYSKARDAYRRVCEAGQTSYCAPAQFELARLSEKLLSSLEDISIQSELAKPVVARFDNRKQAILNDVTATAESADGKAESTVAEGYTNPEWTQEVLWHNSSDWDFDRVSGDLGNGYVQWTAVDAPAK